MTKLCNGYNSLEGLTFVRDIPQQVRYMAGLLQRHNLEVALKLTEVELQITREEACLLLCEVAGELSAKTKQFNS